MMIRGRTKAVAWGFVLAGVVLTTACMSSAPSRLSPRQRTAIEGKSVALQQLLPTHFQLVSSSSTLSGALDPFTAGADAVKGQRAGAMIVEEDHLVDPVTVIAPALLADLETMYGMKATELRGLAGSTSVSTIPSAGTDFVLSVEVSAWSTMYLPTRLSHYEIMLMARARIVEGATGKSLREASCVIRPRNEPDAPTFTELMENDGARLRTEVDYATGACVEVLKHSLVGE